MLNFRSGAIVQNCTFENNYGDVAGDGAANVRLGDMTFSGCTFIVNSAGSWTGAGGSYADGWLQLGGSTTQITGCVFRENGSGWLAGGALGRTCHRASASGWTASIRSGQGLHAVRIVPARSSIRLGGCHDVEIASKKLRPVRVSREAEVVACGRGVVLLRRQRRSGLRMSRDHRLAAGLVEILSWPGSHDVPA